jgi:hypothetical protein
VEFEKISKAIGKHNDVSKSWVLFRKPDDLQLEVFANAVASTGMQEFVKFAKDAGSIRKSKIKNSG